MNELHRIAENDSVLVELQIGREEGWVVHTLDQSVFMFYIWGEEQ